MFKAMLDCLAPRREGGGVGAQPFSKFQITGTGNLPSVYQTSELAVCSIAAAALSLQRLAATCDADLGSLIVDRRLASLWFQQSLQPRDWTMPALWDPIAGDYATSDGWIRLHTNKPQHRDAVLGVLCCDADRVRVASSVLGMRASVLEDAVVEAGGCAAEMYSREAWCRHPQGQSVRNEPLIGWTQYAKSSRRLALMEKGRPLRDIRILDLTRVLAGPVSTRFLASYGAQVLRVDEPGWNEAFPTLEMSAGKLRCGLDLRRPDDLQQFKLLLSQADVFVHGLRADALARLGLGDAERETLNPDLIDVSLCAYGWTGPWMNRRGFDSLVQMSAGIAQRGMQAAAASKPVPLPCQALDHATGYLMASAVLSALAERQLTGNVYRARLSLARTAELLVTYPQLQGSPEDAASITEPVDTDFQDEPEITDWGRARRLVNPATFTDCAPYWSVPAGELRVVAPQWQA